MFQQKRMPLSPIATSTSFIILVAAVEAFGQTTNVINHSVYRPWFGADTAFSAQLKAEAEMVRAHSEAGLNLAHARYETARSVHLELHNWVDVLKARNLRRQLGEFELERQRIRPMDRQTAQVSLKMRQIFEMPWTAPFNVVSGQDLNFLVEQMAVRDPSDRLPHGPVAVAQIQLDPAVIDAIRLCERLPSGRGLPFALSTGEMSSAINWPQPLRAEGLRDARSRFVKSYDRLIASAGDSRVRDAIVRTCLNDLNDLQLAYSRSLVNERYLTSVESHGQHKRSLALMKTLEKQIHRVDETSGRVLHLLPWDEAPKDLVTIVHGMQRRGLEFAPCDAGDEAAYFELFDLMKSLYQDQARQRHQYPQLAQQPLR